MNSGWTPSMVGQGRFDTECQQVSRHDLRLREDDRLGELVPAAPQQRFRGTRAAMDARKSQVSRLLLQGVKQSTADTFSVPP